MNSHLMLIGPGTADRRVRPCGWRRRPALGFQRWGGIVCLLLTATALMAQRELIPFNENWQFMKGDPEGVGDTLDYEKVKPWLLPIASNFSRMEQGAGATRPEGNPGAQVAFTRQEFDDSSWRTLNLPHDWAIEGPFRQEYPGETGKLKWWGPVWYRKHFGVPESDRGRKIYLDVEGAMSYASVWCNDQWVGGWPYGYASWRLELTPFVQFGVTNVLAVRLNSPEESSRWYPGSGIYRNVWLVKTAPVHVTHWGIFVTTPRVTSEQATVQVRIPIANASAADVVVDVSTALFELQPDGQRLGEAIAVVRNSGVHLAGNETGRSTATLDVSKPKLWDIAHPNRYVAVNQIRVKDSVVDEVETPFGIRTFEFTADDGFHLNGRRVPLNGVCLHHDLGALGAAFHRRAAERQLGILQEMGCNAIRTAHNPPAPEFLDLCDQMGFLVMDEAFDCWKGRKKRNDYHLLFPEWHEPDLRAMVRRDRNHPSIVLWSTGNEMPDQRNAAGVALSRQLTAIVKEEDPTRPVTAGCNHDVAGFNGFQNTVDVFGYNYKPQLFASFHATNASIPLYASESASTISSRGEYFFPVSDDKSQGLSDFQVSSYDLYAPRWANPVDREFRFQDQSPYVAGEFVWTGFDYLGEPTPYTSDLSNLNNYSNPEDRARAEKELAEMGKIRTPSRSSYFGIVDLAGFPKDRYYLYQSRWRPDLPLAHILPHWNWPERVGRVTPVHVYTSGDEAELFLNGKSMGRKTKSEFEYRLRWNEIVYEPGELKVIAYKNQKPWATNVVTTTGPASQIRLTADREQIAADGADLVFITAKIVDEDGRIVPRSDNGIQFTIEGPGEVVATDNGDPTSFQSFQSSERQAFNGLALAIVRAKPGASGIIQVHATSNGLTAGSTSIEIFAP